MKAPCYKFLQRTLTLLVVGSLVLLAGQPAQAQDYGSSTQAEQANPSSNLPSWAEPSNSSSRDGLTSNPSQPGDVGTDAPPPPNDPSRIPVDGGLSLLALAGAGYAVRKLRSSKDDEPQDDL